MASFTVYAAYYASDGFEWQQQVLFETELYANCQYEKPSENFHQWTAADGEAFGLSFASVQEANALATVVEGIIREISEKALKKGTMQIKPSDDTEAAGPDTRMKEIPPPKKFQLVRRAVSASDPTWNNIETRLKLTYPSRLRGNVQINSITELTRKQDAAEFAELYMDFGVSDMWLNTEKDQTADEVSRHGFSALGEEQLSFGIPVGTYLLDNDDICGDQKQLVLCQAALGRSLPMTEDSLNSLQEAPLPVGYHSFCIPPQDNAERTLSTFGSIPLGVFEYAFLVPNSSFVLMTHLITFEVKPEEDYSEPPAMSLFQSHPSQLGDQFGKNILAVCAPEFQNSTDIQDAVDQSFEQMWRKIQGLGDSQEQLQRNLMAFQECVEEFKVSCFEHCERHKEETIAFQSHAMEVTQATKDYKFEINRCLSDIYRLQELYMNLKDTQSSMQMISNWANLQLLQSARKREARQLLSSKAVHPHVMGLTEKNKRIVGLRRQAMFKDELISRLAKLLQQKGALTPEDEELIALI